MKKRILFGCAGLLLASSTMFAGWGDRGYDRHERYEHRGGVYVTPGYSYGYGGSGYGYGYAAPGPYVTPYYAPGPYVDEYVAPAPYYGGGWVSGRWGYSPHRGYSGRGDWGHRR